MDLVDVRVEEASVPLLRWTEGLPFRIPREILEGPLRNCAAPGGVLRIPALPGGIDPAWAGRLRLHRAFTDRAPLSGRLPFSYRLVPALLRFALARAMGRWARRRQESWARFPAWPCDLSADFLEDLAARGEEETEAVPPAPVLLSHDLDTAEGIENCLRYFLPMEEAAGARSTNFIVPSPAPEGARLEEILARGHALGIHGHDHTNRTPFMSPAARRRRIESSRVLAARLGALGYRAPSLLRTRGLLEDLAGLYRYDSSIPTSGGRFPVPNNGCASARPFRIGTLIEIPVSLPRDGSLLFLGHTPKEILALWTLCARRIARARGVVVLLTHCEGRFSGRPEMRAVYRDFLDTISSSREMRFSTFAEVVDGAGVGDAGVS